jgi:hypothetical protein
MPRMLLAFTAVTSSGGRTPRHVSDVNCCTSFIKPRNSVFSDWNAYNLQHEQSSRSQLRKNAF